MGKKLIIKGADFSEYAVGGSSSSGTKVMISFDTNGLGTIPFMRVDKDSVVTLPTPIYDGYEFLGWYRDESYINDVGESITASANITLFAKWQSVETILYNEDEWHKGKYITMSGATPVGKQMSAGPAINTSARMDCNRFSILAGQTIELVTRLLSASSQSAFYCGIDESIVVLVERNYTTNLLETPFVYTAPVNFTLNVNVGNGTNSSTGEYDASLDFRGDFRLTIKTPIPYGVNA